MKKKWLWIAAPVLVAVAGGLVLWSTGKLPLGGAGTAAAVADTTASASPEVRKGPDGKEIQPVPVELALVAGRGICAYYRAASVIEADRLVDLVCKTQGRVRSVNVEEGGWVEEGQVLAELENDREKIQLRKAELGLADQRRQLERTRRMLDEDLISRQEFDDVESAFRMAEAERDLAGIALEETFLRAPFSGRVTERQVVQGQQLAVGTAVFRLGDFTPLRVRVHLPEAVARKIQEGQRVLISPEAVPEPLEAVVERVSPVVDPETSTVRLTLLIEGRDGPARVGGFVKVRITTDEHRDALAIPKIALVEEGSLRSVFVAEADTVRKVEIETGLYDETHIEVLDGLFAGDFIVTMGQGGLRTGTLIEALNGADVGYAVPAATAGGAADPAGPDGTLTALADRE